MSKVRIVAHVVVPTVVLFVIATLAACAGFATDDRKGPNGAQPDGYQDATHVVVYRNADNVPNVAVFCLGQYGWAATLSGGDSGGDKAATLVRFNSYDPTCKV